MEAAVLIRRADIQILSFFTHHFVWFQLSLLPKIISKMKVFTVVAAVLTLAR
jgi:hypothetical protein